MAMTLLSNNNMQLSFERVATIEYHKNNLKHTYSLAPTSGRTMSP